MRGGNEGMEVVASRKGRIHVTARRLRSCHLVSAALALIAALLTHPAASLSWNVPLARVV